MGGFVRRVWWIVTSPDFQETGHRHMQQETNLRNLIFAMVAIAGVMLITQIFVWGPEQEAAKERAAAQQTEQSADSNLAPGPVDGSALDSTENSNAVARAQQDVRVPFEGPAIDGSLLLRAARVDHLRLKEYYQTLEDKEAENPEGEVTVFQPQATGDGFYASVGWLTEKKKRTISEKKKKKNKKISQ